MTIHATCPKCATKFDESFEGGMVTLDILPESTYVKCPSCGHVFPEAIPE